MCSIYGIAITFHCDGQGHWWYGNAAKHKKGLDVSADLGEQLTGISSRH
jgi:hypothetical protein